MKELEKLESEDIDDLSIEIRYSLCRNRFTDSNDKLVRILFQDRDDNIQLFFYPENVGSVIENSSVNEPRVPTAQNCALCQEPTLEDVKIFTINETEIQSHESCANYLIDELIDFCKHPKIAVENL